MNNIYIIIYNNIYYIYIIERVRERYRTRYYIFIKEKGEKKNIEENPRVLFLDTWAVRGESCQG